MSRRIGFSDGAPHEETLASLRRSYVFADRAARLVVALAESPVFFVIAVPMIFYVPTALRQIAEDPAQNLADVALLILLLVVTMVLLDRLARIVSGGRGLLALIFRRRPARQGRVNGAQAPSSMADYMFFMGRDPASKEFRLHLFVYEQAFFLFVGLEDWLRGFARRD